MRDVLPDLLRWWESGATTGMGTVVGTWRSAPRPAGAAMLVGPDGTAVGSVSGGCVEGAVYELATEVRDGAPPRQQRYGVSDDDAFTVGLTCGGIIDIFTEAVSRRHFPEFGELAASILAGEPVALATIVVGRPDQIGRHLVIWPEHSVGSLGSTRIDDAVRDDARGSLAHGRTGTLTYGPNGERRGEGLQIFVASFAPAPRMLVFGAIDFAAAVARMGSFLGYRVTVCDARPVFATAKRFPDADEVIVDWPHRYLQAQIEAGGLDPRTVICVLTHDPKFDVPVLRARSASARRLCRCDGIAVHPRGPARPAAGGGPDRGRAGSGCPVRSGSTSAPAPRRRPRCPSPRRSSPGSGPVVGARSPSSVGPSIGSRSPNPANLSERNPHLRS